MAAKEQKNRRYRNSKLSEYRLRRVVECFARDMTAAETVKATRLSAPTVNLIFHRLRERMRDHGLFVAKFGDGTPHPLAAVFNPKHRGVPEHQHDLHAIERIHRILCAQHLKGFERLPASDSKNVEKATRLLRFDAQQPVKRYRIWEAFSQADGNTGAPETKPFDPAHVRQDSAILNQRVARQPTGCIFRVHMGIIIRKPSLTLSIFIPK